MLNGAFVPSVGQLLANKIFRFYAKHNGRWREWKTSATVTERERRARRREPRSAPS